MLQGVMLECWIFWWSQRNLFKYERKIWGNFFLFF